MSEDVVKKTESNKFGNLPGPGPGRPTGSQNKFTSLKQDFLNAYNDERVGGIEGLIEWIIEKKQNKAMFYQWLTKMLPTNVVEDVRGKIEIEINKIITEVRPDE